MEKKVVVGIYVSPDRWLLGKDILVSLKFSIYLIMIWIIYQYNPRF